jgi:hypothetical protein
MTKAWMGKGNCQSNKEQNFPPSGPLMKGSGSLEMRGPDSLEEFLRKARTMTLAELREDLKRRSNETR